MRATKNVIIVCRRGARTIITNTTGPGTPLGLPWAPPLNPLDPQGTHKGHPRVPQGTLYTSQDHLGISGPPAEPAGKLDAAT